MSSVKRRTLLLLIRVTVDLSAVAGAWILAYWLRFHTGLDYPKGLPGIGLYLRLIPFICVIWLFVFSAAGFYRRSMLRRSAVLEAVDIIQSCILASLAFIAFTYFYSEYRYSRITLFFFAVIHPIGIITGRSIVRKALRFRMRQQPARGTLIVGSGYALAHALGLAKTSDFMITKVIGVVLVGDREQVEEGRKFCDKYGIKTYQEPEDWAGFLSDKLVQSVMISVPNAAYGFLEKHIYEISNQVPDVKVIPDLLRYSRLGAGIDIVQGVPVVNIHESPLEGMGSLIKRMIDILGAAFALIILSPLMLLIACIIKVASPGPVFYRQERMGLDGNTFDCLKFRSMPVDVEKDTGPVWAREGEDRATPIGRTLRKYSFDELPQLINVFRGDMSLVGPRPERPVFVDQFRKEVPGYMLRHKVKAGITGWAQVHGWRGNTSIEKRIEYDLFYIQNWSLWLDLRIIGMTINEVIFGKNAY